MITMVMIGKVLRMHHREKKSVREIAKATSLARNTVRKYLRRGKAEQPLYRRFCEQLGEFTRLILFDKRGMGLSERVEIATLEERMDDVRAVLDAIGSKDAALLGISR